MDQLIRASTRVTRSEADVHVLTTIAASLESNPDTANTIPAEARLCLLDLPDPDIQIANIAAITSLSKPELLKRAIESPNLLTIPEIHLLKHRYWSDLSPAELEAQEDALQRLKAVSWAHSLSVRTRLQNVRALLYDENEEHALLTAEMEEQRRRFQQKLADQKQMIQFNLSILPTWLQKLWALDSDAIMTAKAHWGFAGYLDPTINVDSTEFGCRIDVLISHAKSAVCCGVPIAVPWSLDYLDWPDEPSLNITSDDHDQDQAKERQDLETKFEVLRRHFNSLRDQPLEKRKITMTPSRHWTGLRDGILQNAFIVIDQACVDSLYSVHSMRAADSVWVWAIDPDYTRQGAGPGIQYRGYLRVRLQQLVNNFFDARRFHADEFSMQDLWNMSRRERNRAFVSFKEAEQGLFSGWDTVGSAIRPGEGREGKELPSRTHRRFYGDDEEMPRVVLRGIRKSVDEKSPAS